MVCGGGGESCDVLAYFSGVGSKHFLLDSCTEKLDVMFSHRA